VDESRVVSSGTFERITKNDLRRLARIAEQEREDFFARRPDWRLLYRRRLLVTALTGRSATHFCNGTSRFEEFELCLFFAAHTEAAFPHNWISHRDFGRSKFGQTADGGVYAGRRIILRGRSLVWRPGDNPVVALQSYLRSGRTPTARQLRDESVVLIAPERFLAYVAWPTLAV
jgi:hypothetical protein